MNQAVLITGGAGFIGCNFVRDWLASESGTLINLDKLTYAGSLANLADLQSDSRHVFVRGDIGDAALIDSILQEYRPWAVVHFAAESHVDRSIHGPEDFIRTNVVGTFRLLESVRGYWGRLSGGDKGRLRFLHVSTDEVYGSLSPGDPAFTETTPYAPNSPYSASKAASDHLVRAYHHTYGLPVLTTNCSNNYGPYQFPEKLIPLMVLNALEGKPLPVYGDGGQVRDWLYVGDHCEAIRRVLKGGRVGETYNIGGKAERANVDVVRAICGLLDELHPAADRSRHASLISFVPDRPGHDRRYAMDISRMENELGWVPRQTFDSGLRKTVRWYLDNLDWARSVTRGEYRSWIERNYAGRSAK